jgi:L-ascorbate metabolism protein UlaG (beta-lactamase superfamily)
MAGGPLDELARRFGRLRHRDDPGVQEQLRWSAHAVELPVGLELQWLGTAGFRLTSGDTTIVIDPYISRASLSQVARRGPLITDAGAVDRHLGAVDAVLVGHTHFDHAVDVAYLARRDGCSVYGSSSLEHLLGLHGLATAAVVVEPHRRYAIGPFTVSFTPSVHSKLLAGVKVPSDGELTCDSLDHLGAGAYRCGQVWGISIEVGDITLYHQGSANLVDDEVRARDVDVFLCGIAGRLYTPRFVERAIRALRPALVVAHHHDDFFRPVDGDMGFSFNVNLGGFVEEVSVIDPWLPVRTMDPFEVVRS